jgi:hypothetical protein
MSIVFRNRTAQGTVLERGRLSKGAWKTSGDFAQLLMHLHFEVKP